MNANKILNADILDIIFEGRNKDYGAYELRKTYNRRVIIAIGIMAAICLSGFLTSIFANDHDKNNRLIVKDVILDNIRPEVTPPEPPPPPPPPPPQHPPVVEITRFTPPIIVEDDKVEEPPPTQDDLADSKIGTVDQDGKKDDSFIVPPEEKGTGPVALPAKPEENYERMFLKVEKEAKFPGGPDAWRKYLERNLNANAAQEDGAPIGNYTVKVQFVVDKEGSISEVTAIESPKACPSCVKEAVKIIQKGGRWEPAIQNGRKVIYQAVQYIIFKVAEE